MPLIPSDALEESSPDRRLLVTALRLSGMVAVAFRLIGQKVLLNPAGKVGFDRT